MKTLIFTPVIDDRFEHGTVTSRIGIRANAIPFDNQFDLFECVINQKKENPDIACVLIDEAQFLTKQQVYQLTEITHKIKIPVLCYGLRSDFLGEPFEGSKYLLAWAEELQEIKTICHCGSKATMNMRIDEKGNAVITGSQIEIGGNDRYISMCHKHFKAEIEKAKKTQKVNVLETEFI